MSKLQVSLTKKDVSHVYHCRLPKNKKYLGLTFQGIPTTVPIPPIPLLIWPHPPLFLTVRVCVWISVSDRIVVNVSLDNSGLGWLTLCQEWRVPQTKSVQQSVFINYSVHFKHSDSSFYNVHDWSSPSALVLTPGTQIHCQVTGFL